MSHGLNLYIWSVRDQYEAKSCSEEKNVMPNYSILLFIKKNPFKNKKKYISIGWENVHKKIDKTITNIIGKKDINDYKQLHTTEQTYLWV